ncbi:tripartite motif-containing protein 16-like [Menidia menidia]
MEGRRQQIQQRIHDKKQDGDLLQQEVEAIDQSADKTLEDSEKMFTQLIRLIQNRRSDVEQQVRSQQQTAVRGVKELQQKLEQEITELQRKDAELQQLSRTKDHIQFLTSCPLLPALRESTHSSSIRVRPLSCFEDVTAAVSELTDKLQHILTQDWTKVSLAAAQPDVLRPPEPESRADFLRCSCKITLDPNTAHIKLLLSERNRKVRLMDEPQSYRDDQDRFTRWFQVLSRESLTGRCYWEVERKGRGVGVAVAYKNIRRAGSGNESGFGFNDKSWALYCDEKGSTFWFNDIETSISAPPPSRVGVYLDHRAGILSFYSVSKTRTLLHRVQTTFTQPLYAGLYVYWPGDTAELFDLR